MIFTSFFAPVFLHAYFQDALSERDESQSRPTVVKGIGSVLGGSGICEADSHPRPSAPATAPAAPLRHSIPLRRRARERASVS